MERSISGELRNFFRVNYHQLLRLTIVGKLAWQQEGGAKGRCQYCTDDLGTVVYFRALQGHSGRNLIDPLLQDNVVIQSGFFQLFTT